ncbi:hypothetical protein BHE74_00053520 [Ensete ventricosum]|uniref:Uncharacterized protein n=1 Tax=Ensete ventricosum TaxID=4639 RepID=A0A426XZY3_ENSVE|nr:hypothetical protein B296_00055360 [Ensete ventricosum]RWV98641.1 hypothetical protein GW17_00038495 [Ensete ventricosum]RWW41028.1 hypothetical protein BHE74_00053520 [Ensete ventricosum]RZS14566.1 hypothetical protein BHM03_00046271 [Ensete ventricosum]
MLLSVAEFPSSSDSFSDTGWRVSDCSGTSRSRFYGVWLSIDLANFGGEILCQPDAFLCSVNDVRVSSRVDQRPRNLEVGAEVGIDPQTEARRPGAGISSWVWICDFFGLFGFSLLLVVQKILAPGEVFIVDAACVIAMTSSINFQLKYSNPTKRVVFGVSSCTFLLVELDHTFRHSRFRISAE